MRYFIAILITAALFLACGNSKNRSAADPSSPDALGGTETIAGTLSGDTADYTGTYHGTLPCADCDGIEVRLTLHHDKQYELRTKHIARGEGEKHIESEYDGAYSWNAATRTVTLNGITNQPNKYIYSDGTLTQLDMAGNVVGGPLADKYVLKKRGFDILPDSQ